MSKQRRHRTPPLEMRSDPITERYWTEVDYSTGRLEKRYQKAQRALEAASARAEQARAIHRGRQHDKAARREYERLAELVEERRRELKEIERLMMPSDYAGRDGVRRRVRHESGDITIPLGAAAGGRKRQAPVPVFPVHVKREREK